MAGPELLSRRGMLKLSAVTAAGLALNPDKLFGNPKKMQESLADMQVDPNSFTLLPDSLHRGKFHLGFIVGPQFEGSSHTQVTIPVRSPLETVRYVKAFGGKQLTIPEGFTGIGRIASYAAAGALIGGGLGYLITGEKKGAASGAAVGLAVGGTLACGSAITIEAKPAEMEQLISETQPEIIALATLQPTPWYTPTTSDRQIKLDPTPAILYPSDLPTITLTPTETPVPLPLPPELDEKKRKFFWPTQMNYDWLPPIRDDSRTTIIDDPTGILGGKVFLSEILSQYIPDDGIRRDNDRHRPYYPGPRHDPLNPPHGPENDDTGWGLPIVMEAQIYFDEIQPDIGINVHALGPKVAGEGKQIYAMAGDYHVPYPGLPPDYKENRPATNTILAQQDGKWYILPMTHEQARRWFYVGSFVDLNASIPEKQWVELMTISSKVGIWTLIRLYGQERYRVMGYVEQKNPDVPAFSANFGPYALPNVSNFRAYQKDLTVASWGDVAYFPPGGPRP